MIKISKLTTKVISFSEVPNFDTDDCVDWALEMIFLGYDSPNLFILAGLQKPTNYFESIDYLKKALKELGIEILNGDKAVLSYASYFINKIAEGEDIRQNLKKVYQYCQSRDYEKLVYDFYLLYWAWDDFDYGQEYTPYWEEANPLNIENIVVNVAKKWVENHI
jgi:hypothetical protein